LLSIDSSTIFSPLIFAKIGYVSNPFRF
jgi:hypothetical protein